MNIISIVAVGVLTSLAYLHGWIVGRKTGIDRGKEEAFKKIFNDFNEWKENHIDYKCEKGEKIKVTPRFSKNEKGDIKVISVNFEHDKD